MARVLIVDDDETDRISLRAYLEQAGHDTFLAEDGEEALRSYGGRTIDLIVTDLQMPKVHGLELITVLRDLTPPLPIIAICGTGEPKLDLAQAVGADETLGRPVDPSALLRAVTQLVSAEV